MDSPRNNRPDASGASASNASSNPPFDADAQTLEREAPPPVAHKPPPPSLPEAPEPPAAPQRKSIHVSLAALVASAALVLIAAAGVLFWKHSHRAEPPSTGKIRLAVLPFENLTGDPSQEYVSDGFAEEMISQLGRLNHDQLEVIARTSVVAYKNTGKPVRKIARELNVNYVLEGSVRNSSGGYRIATQLVRGGDEAQVWSQEYDRPIGDLMKLEGELAGTVADEIQVQLLPRKPADVRVARSVSQDAYVYYLQGRFAFNQRNGPNLFNAVSSFDQAIRQDPGFAAAYAGLADSYNMLMFYGYTTEASTLSKSRDAATRAIALDDALAEGHASLGYIHFIWDWDWPGAEQEFQRAIALNRNYAPAHHWYALFLTAMGRRDESLSQVHLAHELDPLSPIVTSAYAYIAYFAGKYDQAVVQCKTVLQQDPKFMVAHNVLGLAHEAQADYAGAIAAFERAIELSGTRPGTYLDNLGHTFGISGQREQAEMILSEIQAKAKSGKGDEISTVATLIGLNENDRALDVMEKNFRTGNVGLMWLKVDPRFNPLRSNPRFQALLQRAGFPP